MDDFTVEVHVAYCQQIQIELDVAESVDLLEEDGVSSFYKVIVIGLIERSRSTSAGSGYDVMKVIGISRVGDVL
jgi:hypothetical protein